MPRHMEEKGGGGAILSFSREHRRNSPWRASEREKATVRNGAEGWGKRFAGFAN